MASSVILNQEDLFYKTSKEPVIANDFPTVTEEDKQRFDELLLTVYEADTLQPHPQCSCGKLKGMFRLGDRCDDCGGKVTETFEPKIESLIWLVPLPDTPAFITPIMWELMSKCMKQTGGFDTLKFLTDPYYRPPKPQIPDRIQFLLEKGHKRGLNYFYDNFDEIIDDIVVYNGKNKIPEKLAELKQLVTYNRDKVFTKLLPVPNRVMFPIEKSGKASYGDKSMINIVNAVRVIQEGESRSGNLSVKQLESRMIRCNELFAKFHYQHIKSVIGSKNGVARQHLFGGRWHFSSRAVIGSIFEPHDFREVYFPWVVAMEQYHIQIVNKLIKRGHSLEEINYLTRKHATQYSEYIDEIFQELLDESPYMGLPIILQRNPTISRPSAILVYVTKIKKDANDHTISISVGILTGMNADLITKSCYIVMYSGYFS